MISIRPKVALMSYAMDNRSAKGIALYTRKLIEGLVSSNEIDFYLVHYDEVMDPLYKKAHEIIMPKVRLPYGSRFISQLLFFWKYRKQPFDVVHWFHPRVYPFYWLVPAKKIIVTVHGAGDITAPTYFVFSRSVFNFILKHFHKSIDTVIVDSNFAKAEVVEHYGFPEEKVKVIYLGGGEIYKSLDKTESLSAVWERYGFSGNYILDISRLQPHKNVSSLIRAYSEMRSKYSEHNQKLLIVGGGAYKKVYEYAVADNSPFKNDIIFIEFAKKEDLNFIYSGSDLFVFPSLNEGFGLPVLEAMASGVPVITSNETSMPEIGGNAVLTLDPLDVAGLARSMRKVLLDGELREKMVRLGLEQAKKFTWQSTVEETKKLYL